MAWFPEFETPEYQAHLEKKIEDEARSWNEYCEERVLLFADNGREEDGRQSYARALEEK
jgi:hypothetical protein